MLDTKPTLLEAIAANILIETIRNSSQLIYCIRTAEKILNPKQLHIVKTLVINHLRGMHV